MFYIINERDQIIAADNTLLSLLKIEHIDDLTKQIILGDTQVDATSSERTEFITKSGTFTYTTQTSTLSSLLGDLRLVQLSTQEDTTDLSSLVIDSSENSMPTMSTDTTDTIDSTDDLIFIKDETPIGEEQESISPTSNEVLEELSFLDDTDISIETKEEPPSNVENDAIFSLTIPNAPETAIDQINLEENHEVEKETISFENLQAKEVEEPTDTTPIIIYIDEVSENIGISCEDYNTFLNEYIDTAISLEDDLKNDDSQVRKNAINTLVQLGDVLELPMLNNILSKLATSTHENIVNSFYSTLSRLTVEKKYIASNDTGIDDNKDISSQIILANEVDKPKDDNIQKTPASFSLEGVKPIHFDFQLEEAANDLSLPVELIEEFVHDFIEQAHIETEKMLEAYEKGDLDTIQKIGHMLKGASSNLRINALSDTLYNIQFCEDISQMEDFIKQYWGHFLSFEQQIDVLSN